MTVRHPLDGDAIAADRHYERAFSYPYCAGCGARFEAEVERSTTYRDLCTDCEEEEEDEP